MSYCGFNMGGEGYCTEVVPCSKHHPAPADAADPRVCRKCGAGMATAGVCNGCWEAEFNSIDAPAPAAPVPPLGTTGDHDMHPRPTFAELFKRTGPLPQTAPAIAAPARSVCNHCGEKGSDNSYPCNERDPDCGVCIKCAEDEFCREREDLERLGLLVGEGDTINDQRYLLGRAHGRAQAERDTVQAVVAMLASYTGRTSWGALGPQDVVDYIERGDWRRFLEREGVRRG